MTTELYPHTINPFTLAVLHPDDQAVIRCWCEKGYWKLIPMKTDNLTPNRDKPDGVGAPGPVAQKTNNHSHNLMEDV